MTDITNYTYDLEWHMQASCHSSLLCNFVVSPKSSQNIRDLSAIKGISPICSQPFLWPIFPPSRYQF